jgi:antitoxin (DNA-binding transcriptional repressor) of toxin-antitoxin stability system
MRTLAIWIAPRWLAEYADKLKDEVVVLTKRNRPVAAIVPLRNVDRETPALSTHPGFLAVIERSRQQVAEGKTLSVAEMRAALKRGGRTSRSARQLQRGRARAPR